MSVLLEKYAFPQIIIQYLGNYDNLLYSLISFIIVEFITTALVSLVKCKNLSRLSMKFFSQKIFEFLLVGIGHIIDVCLSSDGSAFRTIIIFFYIGYEGIIILASAIELGLPVPHKLKDFLENILHNNDDISSK